MRVSIKIEGKNPFWLQVEPYYTFRTVKRKLEYLHGVPEPQQTILHNSQVMNENTILSKCHIQNEDTLTVELKTDAISLRCKESKGWNWLYTVKHSDTIQEVKQRIFESSGMPVKIQRLMFNGLELKNEYQLSNYNINSGDTVILKADHRPIINELKSFCSILEEMAI